MPLLSKVAMRMSTLDRTKQELNWYTDGINLCVDALSSYRIADEIEAECKRRNIPYRSVCTREMIVGEHYTSFEIVTMPYDIQKICIYRSPEAFQAYDENVQKLHASSCVAALKKKQLADWAVTAYNKNWNRNKEGPHSDNYIVWIQPASEVRNSGGTTEAEDMEGVTTDWVYR